jgi:TetR/AcrR family transcriptional regulator
MFAERERRQRFDRSTSLSHAEAVAAIVARKHDPEASRAAILDAAEGLFLERGFAATSMSEIAERSGVTKSLIHHHFNSKEGLWAEIKRRRFGSYHAAQLALYARGLTHETIKASMHAYFHFLRANPQVHRMITWMRLEGDRECADLVVDLRTRAIAQIAAAQQAGVLRPEMPPEFVLMIFLGLVNAWFDEGGFATGFDDGRVDHAEVYLEHAWKVFASSVLVDASRAG